MLKVNQLSTNREVGVGLDLIDFTLDGGQVLFLIGPNGCGKTNLLRTLAGFNDGFQGSIMINHHDLHRENHKAKAQLGYLPNPVVIDSYLTGAEYLELVGAAHSIAPKSRLVLIKEIAEAFDCHQLLYSPINHLSQATVQQIGLIASLIHNPKVVLWDEPTAQLDYGAQVTLSEIIIELRSKGHSVLIASNNLIFANSLADRIILLEDGRILAEGTIKQLANQSKSKNSDLESVYRKFYL